MGEIYQLKYPIKVILEILSNCKRKFESNAGAIDDIIDDIKDNSSNEDLLKIINDIEDALNTAWDGIRYGTKDLENALSALNKIDERRSRFNERRANYTLELDFDINKWEIKNFVRNFEFFNELNLDGINEYGNRNVLKISANDIEVLEEFIVYYLGGKGYDKQEYEFLRKTIKSGINEGYTPGLEMQLQNYLNTNKSIAGTNERFRVIWDRDEGAYIVSIYDVGKRIDNLINMARKEFGLFLDNVDIADGETEYYLTDN